MFKQEPHLTYVGHSTVAIEMDGTCLLTDPLLRHRVGHLRRHKPLDARHEQIRPDAVLISHLHQDHFDLPSLRQLGSRTRLIVPRGAGRTLRRWGFHETEEISVGERIRVGTLTVEATVTEHSGFRPPFGPTAECIGYLIHGSRRIYFVGDTALTDRLVPPDSSLDLALLPVWGWGPWLRGGHLTPRQAAEALRLLRPRLAVPIHWGTFFPLGMGWTQPRFLTRPPHDFRRHAEELVPETDIHVLNPGQELSLARRGWAARGPAK